MGAAVRTWRPKRAWQGTPAAFPAASHMAICNPQPRESSQRQSKTLRPRRRSPAPAGTRPQVYCKMVSPTPSSPFSRRTRQTSISDQSPLRRGMCSAWRGANGSCSLVKLTSAIRAPLEFL